MPKIEVVTLILTLHFSLLNVDVNKGEKKFKCIIGFL